MALSPTTVATNVAALSVSGVTVRDLTAVPEQVLDRDCPLVYPDPENFIDLISVTDETDGPDGTRLKAVVYGLNYVYLHRAVGSERGLYAKSQDEVSKLYTFISAVIANCDSLTPVDIKPRHGPLMVLKDPAASAANFRGCKMTLLVTEWINP